MSIQGRPTREASIRVLHAALHAGIELIDTADAYCLDEDDKGHNERLVGEALRQWPGGREVVVATKGGLRRPGGRWVHDGRPKYLKEACENSLRALGVEAITLYQLHAPDRRVPFTDSVGALADLRQEGKILHAGLSNVDVDQLLKAEAVVPVASVQNQASPFHPEGLIDGVLEACQERGIAFIAYSPVGGWRAGRTAHERALQEVGRRSGATPHQVAIAWLLQKSEALVPIPGASKVRSAVDSAAAAEIQLDRADVALLDRTYQASPV
jgi:aryl-alcohol dehydrogenase-like predicted oxidoreductase